MNNYTKLFYQLMDLMNITIEKQGNYYLIYDEQLGEYKQDKYYNATQILDRLEAFIYDYVVSPLEEEEQEYINTIYEYKNWSDYVDYLKQSSMYDSDCKRDIDCLDMICNYSDKVEL